MARAPAAALRPPAPEPPPPLRRPQARHRRTNLKISPNARAKGSSCTSNRMSKCSGVPTDAIGTMIAPYSAHNARARVFFEWTADTRAFMRECASVHACVSVCVCACLPPAFFGVQTSVTCLPSHSPAPPKPYRTDCEGDEARAVLPDQFVGRPVRGAPKHLPRAAGEDQHVEAASGGETVKETEREM